MLLLLILLMKIDMNYYTEKLLFELRTDSFFIVYLCIYVCTFIYTV